MTTAAAPPFLSTPSARTSAPAVITARGSKVPRVSWDEHREYLHSEWRPGQHTSIITHTDGGKSHLVRRGLLPLWLEARVIVVDPTDDAKNFSAPFKPVAHMPGRMQRHATPAWFRLVPELDVEGREATRGVLAAVYREGGWVLVIDETRQVTDPKPPCYGLSAYYDQLMLRARKKGVTVISATQSPRWVPKSMYEQAAHAYIGRIRDREARRRLSEISGADTEDIVGALNHLQRFEFLFVGPPHEDRLYIVKAPR